MWPLLRHGAATFIIAACLGLAAAQLGLDRRGDESADASAMQETTGSTRGSKRAPTELALSDKERGRIYEGVMRIPGASVADVPAPEVADALPSGVPLQDLPAGMTQEIPLVQDHKFVKFRRPDRGGRSEEPRGCGHDPSLQASAVSWLIINRPIRPTRLAAS